MLEIREAGLEDLHKLSEIERAASTRFESVVQATGLSHEQLQETLPRETLEAALSTGTLWLAQEGAVAVGFLAAQVMGEELYILEVDVLKSHGRRGLGKQLMQKALEKAQQLGLQRVVLRTYREVPWNAPFYRKLGFEELHENELSPALLMVLEEEDRRGLRGDLRVFMSCGVRV